MRDGSFEVGDRDPPSLERGIGSLRGDAEKSLSRGPSVRNPCSETTEWNFPRGGGGKVSRARIRKEEEKREQMVGRSRPGLMPHGGKSPGFIKPSRRVEGRRMKRELAVKFEAARPINIYIYIYPPVKKEEIIFSLARAIRLRK